MSVCCCLVAVVSDSFVTPWTVACQAPLFMGFPGQEYWSGLPLPSPGHLPNPGIEPTSPALAEGFFITEPPGKSKPQLLPPLSLSEFPGGSDNKASVYNAGDPGSSPGLGRSPGEGNGKPLKYSCLGNRMDRGAWQATVHGVTKESDTT